VNAYVAHLATYCPENHRSSATEIETKREEVFRDLKDAIRNKRR
jgi:hypothetical protein